MRIQYEKEEQMYKFRINKKNSGYYFALYPNNNNHQEIGESCRYEKFSDCKAGLEKFRLFVKTNDLQQCMHITKTGENVIPRIDSANMTLFVRTYPYWQKSQCKKWLQRIIDNIDAELKE